MCDFRFWMGRFLLLSLLFAVPTAVCLAGATLEQTSDETLVMAELEDIYQLLELHPLKDKSRDMIVAKVMASGFTLNDEKNSVFGLTMLSFAKYGDYKNILLSFTFYNDSLAEYSYFIDTEWVTQTIPAKIDLELRIYQLWQAQPNPEYDVSSHHGLTIVAIFEEVYADYYLAIKNGRGNMTPANLSEQDIKYHYTDLVSDLKNNDIHAGQCSHYCSELDLFIGKNRLDLLENILYGYNPGARILAAQRILQRHKDGTPFSQSVMDRIIAITKLNDPILSGNYGQGRKPAILSEQATRKLIGFDD